MGDGNPKNLEKKDYISHYKDFDYYFDHLKDVHLIIFIGFSPLYCSLKDHIISSTAFIFICMYKIFPFFSYLWNNDFRKKHHIEYSSCFSRIKLDRIENNINKFRFL